MKKSINQRNIVLYFNWYKSQSEQVQNHIFAPAPKYQRVQMHCRCTTHVVTTPLTLTFIKIVNIDKAVGDNRIK